MLNSFMSVFFKVVFSIMFTIPFIGSCHAHEIGGKSADDLFKNEKQVTAAKIICGESDQSLSVGLSDDISINQAGLDGISLLMWAISCDNEVAVESLLDLGADPNHTSEFEMTPVTQAAGLKNGNLLKLLIQKGGDPSAGVGRGHTHTALGRSVKLGVYEENWSNFDRLIEADADIYSDHRLRPERTIADFLIDVYGQYCKVLELLNDDIISINDGLKYGLETRDVDKDSPNYKCRQELVSRING